MNSAVDALIVIGAVGVLYPYVLYPGLLALMGQFRHRERTAAGTLPSVTLIVPVSNEESRIARKVLNTSQLSYPSGRLHVVFISDGSTDRTTEILRADVTAGMEVVELSERQGKAAALNAGLARADRDIVVFTDASIQLRANALEQLVAPFADPTIGCVSGEDRIAESGGEAWYGRYELTLRRLESRVHSIAGASGSFYAQRRSVCTPFTPGMAPDFLSVLRTVEQGYRAVTQPSAIGSMTSVKDPKREFDRKVRTLIRGYTTLLANRQMLNPARQGSFAFILASHKLMRWIAPLFLAVLLMAPVGRLGEPLYMALFVLQLSAYGTAGAAFMQIGGLDRSVVGKGSLYFATVNAAAFVAWWRYLRGERLEVWTPTAR